MTSGKNDVLNYALKICKNQEILPHILGKTLLFV